MLRYISEQQIREIVGVGKEFLIQRLQLLKHIICRTFAIVKLVNQLRGNHLTAMISFRSV
jgi:uncharacterized Fe-S radical SAM superfamily protein PflX